MCHGPRSHGLHISQGTAATVPLLVMPTNLPTVGNPIDTLPLHVVTLFARYGEKECAFCAFSHAGKSGNQGDGDPLPAADTRIISYGR